MEIKPSPQIALAVRNAACGDCAMALSTPPNEICRTAEGNYQADILIVTKNSLTTRSRNEMIKYLTEAGFDPSTMAFTGVVKCAAFDRVATKADIRACKKYLDAEINFIKPKWIIAFGSEALLALTGKVKITEARGRKINHSSGAIVLPTISPGAIFRNPGQAQGFISDLSYFNKLTLGLSTGADMPTPDQIHNVTSKDDLNHLLAALDLAEEAAFDIESTGFDEFADGAAIISLSITTNDENNGKHVWQIPLWHNDSPWQNQWVKVLNVILAHLKKVRRRIAHNGKFDCRWLRHFSVHPVSITFDTMLAAHLLDENRPKGLKPLARMMLGAEPWEIEIKPKKDQPWWEAYTLDQILVYNGLDTWHTLGLYHTLRAQLIAQSRPAKLFAKVIIPASEVLTDAERHGVWTDRKRVNDRWQESQKELNRIDRKLNSYVPANHEFTSINWNPSNFAKWFLFDHLDLPVLARGKQKEDGTPGLPSMAEAILLTLQETLHNEEDERAPIIDLLLERTKWQKYTSSFFRSYSELMDDDDYIHTTFKLTGTVTGRLSSGKADADKVTGVRAANIRGVNMQQVPRDPFVRGVFGAPEAHWFVEADYSQVELRVAAYLAQETNMLRLYATGQDIHMTMAMRMTGKPAHLISKEERKKAKAVNFGFLYGMGWRKFIQTAWSNYGVHVTEHEAIAFRKAFFNEFPGLLKWHASQRAFVRKFGYVISPVGRVRHLPDIHSANGDVRAEAERQAINSPVQSFASDMALWAMVRIDRQFKKLGMQSQVIGTVHDAVNFQIPQEEMRVALPIIKRTMQTLPLNEFGIDLNIPIIADLKAGKYWGGSEELTEEQVFDWQAA